MCAGSVGETPHQKVQRRSLPFLKSRSKQLGVGKERGTARAPHTRRRTGKGKLPEPPSSQIPGRPSSHPVEGTRPPPPNFQEQAREPDAWFHARRQLAQEPQESLDWVSCLAFSQFLLTGEGREAWSGSNGPNPAHCLVLQIKYYQSTVLCICSAIEGVSVQLPKWLSRKESACLCRRCRRPGFGPWVRSVAWRRAWQPTPVFLPGKPHGQRGLVGCSPWGRACLSTHVGWCKDSTESCHWRPCGSQSLNI